VLLFANNWSSDLIYGCCSSLAKKLPIPKASKSIKNDFAFAFDSVTNFSRNVTLNVLSRATVVYLLFFALEQLAGSLQRRKMRIYDS
jgi:hypothetical protein